MARNTKTEALTVEAPSRGKDSRSQLLHDFIVHGHQPTNETDALIVSAFVGYEVEAQLPPPPPEDAQEPAQETEPEDAPQAPETDSGSQDPPEDPAGPPAAI